MARPAVLLALVFIGLLLGLGAALGIVSVVGERAGPRYEVEEPAGIDHYFRSDPVLGYAPTPGLRVRSSRRSGDQSVYDVHYTIDENGLRATPASGDGGPAIVFFGGSFTFGEGVEDDEALPAQLATWMRDDTRILNAGFHGYGPHQMLRSLETGRLDPLLSDGVEHVVYQGVRDHIRRVAGRTTWDPGGPAYEFSDGGVRYVGPFRSPLAAMATQMLNRFASSRTLLQEWLEADPAEAEADRDLYVAVVARAAALARERWGARFTVVFWDRDGDPLAARLEDRGLDVLRVSDALEGRSWRRFVLGVDRHPNRAGHDRVAKALTRHIRRARRAEARVLSPREDDVLNPGQRGGSGGPTGSAGRTGER